MRGVASASFAFALIAIWRTSDAQQVTDPVPPRAAITLDWQAPQQCPRGDEVLGEVHRRLGGPPAAARSPLRATARVWRDGALFRAHVTTEQGGMDGDKDLDDPSCATLSEAVALVLALTFDADAVAAASRLPAPVAGTVVPSQAVTAAPRRALRAGAGAPREPEADHARAKPPEIGVGARGEAVLGALPGVALGVGAAVSLAWAPAVAEVSVAWYPGRSARLDQSSAGGDFELLAGGIRGCYRAAVGSVDLAPCAGVEAGRVAALGKDAPRTNEAAGAWIAPFAEVRALVPLAGPVHAVAALGVGVPVFRNEFVLKDLSGAGDRDVVHRAAAAVGRAAVGAEVRF